MKQLKNQLRLRQTKNKRIFSYFFYLNVIIPKSINITDIKDKIL